MPAGSLFNLRGVSRVGIASLAPLALLEAAQATLGGGFVLTHFLLRAFFAVTLVLAVQRLQRIRSDPTWRWLGLLAVCLAAALYTAWTYSTAAAQIALWTFLLWLIWLDNALASGTGRGMALAASTLLAGIAGVAPVLASQLETRFADEEFFVALQAALLSFTTLLLIWGCRWLRPKQSTPVCATSRGGRKVLLLFIIAAIGGLVATLFLLRAYQASFYTATAPAFPGIGMPTPFLCGDLPVTPEIADGKAVFQSLLAAMEASPYNEAPEYGMLALGRQDMHWAQAFRSALLADAQAGRFTEPANSVKWSQHAAALRAYYFDRVRQTFPQLFTPGEEQQVQAWFAAINHRALTVEWVDWLYAAAFAMRPQGPYENQETGAGLLSILEATGLAAPDLHDANLRYLAQQTRGWAARFRNTDDAYIYQLEWLTNAYFQRAFTGVVNVDHTRHSFEWLLLQVLPDGSAPYYNHIGEPALAPIAYLGATLEQDPRYLWLAGRSLQQPVGKYGFIRAQPGVEQPVTLAGQPPRQGSCLLYGDAGLPTQHGPLAPDKIVLRDGWAADSSYALLNLRFTGWHRYKATNTISLVYQGKRLVADILEAEPIPWLPVGRSLFRDKRIPREHLSGVLIENSGLSAALYQLTGIGSRWAQDPPHYAEVVDFQTNQPIDDQIVDWSHTRITGWRGWRHDRWIYLVHGGPLIVVDRAAGPPDQRAALIWRFIDSTTVDKATGRRQAGTGDSPVVFQVLPLVDAPDEGYSQASEAAYLYKASQAGRLDVASIFLPGAWTTARLALETQVPAPHLLIKTESEQVVIPLAP